MQIQKRYRVAVINSILNFRKYVDVDATCCHEAVQEAKSKLASEGYANIESVCPIVE